MKRSPILLLLLAVLFIGAALWQQMPTATPDAVPVPTEGTASTSAPSANAADWPTFLPQEARPVLRRIADGSEHPYRQDGSTFQNRERRLPEQPRGYYREYTVETPGLGHRGARRIVTGGRPPAVYFYTDDHYASFRRFDPPRELLP